MSLKLGNTNIAGTQVLYSTTGNKTDGAMTQKATTDELNNCIHKTGNETISGVKKFTDDIFITDNDNIGATINLQSPVASSLLLEIPGDTWASLNVQPNTTGVLLTYGDRSGYIPLYCGASGNINTAITTTSISLNSVKFGNGVIINWGTLSSGKTITYDIPFTGSDTYTLVFNNNSGTNGYGRGDIVTSKSSTSATVDSLCENPIRWIAIGY